MLFYLSPSCLCGVWQEVKVNVSFVFHQKGNLLPMVSLKISPWLFILGTLVIVYVGGFPTVCFCFCGGDSYTTWCSLRDQDWWLDVHCFYSLACLFLFLCLCLLLLSLVLWYIFFSFYISSWEVPIDKCDTHCLLSCLWWDNEPKEGIFHCYLSFLQFLHFSFHKLFVCLITHQFLYVIIYSFRSFETQF